MKIVKHVVPLLFVFFISYFTVKELFIPGFFPMHDDTQVSRVFEMGKALSDGQFPVRWVSDLGYGYGYPIFNYYGPLSYYVGGLFVVSGIDPLLATKLMIAIGLFLAVIGMYFLGRSMWGVYGGVIAAVLYMYAPYHALNVYVRGAIGELWAYGFLPFMAWGFYRLAIRDDQLAGRRIWVWIAVASLGYAGVILSHNLTAMMITPFLFVGIIVQFLVFLKKKKSYTMRYTLYAVGLGLMIAAFYWVPALLEVGYTNVKSQIGGGADFHNHYVCIAQLWNSPWMFGGSAKGCLDGLSFQIGKIHIIVTMIALLLAGFGFTKKSLRFYSYSVITCFVGFLVSIFFTLEWSQFIWNNIAQMAYFQYPWRFLIVINFFAALLGGSIFYFLQELKLLKEKEFLLVVFTAIASLGIVFFYANYFTAQTIYPKTSDDYTSSEALRWDISKISDEYMPIGFTKPKNKDQVINSKVVTKTDGMQIILQDDKTHALQVKVNGSGMLLIQLAHFPAWEFFVNGSRVIPERVNNGYFLTLSGAQNTISAVFRQTHIEVFSDIISLVGISLLVIGILYRRKDI